MGAYILGIDIGTGSVKAVAVDTSGTSLCSEQNYYPTQVPQAGWNEQDPKFIFQSFTDSVSKVIDRMGSQPAGLSFSSAMHSLMALDASHKPLTPLLIWSDSRSEAIASRLRKSPGGKILYEITGTPIHSMSPLCKIIWLKENAPEVFQRTAKFISIKEYIWFRLTGEFLIDHSLASATGLFDIEGLCWSREALSLASIGKDQLSEPVPTGHISRIAADMVSPLHLSPDTALCIGASDGCLANLGTNALLPGVAAISLGTSGAIRVSRSRPLRDYSRMLFNYILDADHFICGGPVNNAGNIIQWLLEKFLGEKHEGKAYEKLFSETEKVPAGCEGLVLLPYLHGERAPVWDERSSGVFFGIRPNHERAHFMRAVLEGICFAFKDILSSLAGEGYSISQLNASGGLIRSAPMMQLLADITGTRICVRQTEDASALGAALLALKSMRMIPVYDLPEPSSALLFHPQEVHKEVYEKNYSIYKKLYPALMELMSGKSREE